MAWRKAITWTNDDQVIEACRLTRPLWVKRHAPSFSYCFIDKNYKKRIILNYAFEVGTIFATLLETYIFFNQFFWKCTADVPTWNIRPLIQYITQIFKERTPNLFYSAFMMTSWNGNMFRVTGLFCGHKGQWRGALMFSLICAWINDWVHNREAGDLRCHRARYNIIVMLLSL